MYKISNIVCLFVFLSGQDLDVIISRRTLHGDKGGNVTAEHFLKSRGSPPDRWEKSNPEQKKKVQISQVMQPQNKIKRILKSEKNPQNSSSGHLCGSMWGRWRQPVIMKPLWNLHSDAHMWHWKDERVEDGICPGISSPYALPSKCLCVPYISGVNNVTAESESSELKTKIRFESPAPSPATRVELQWSGFGESSIDVVT